jgi:type III secretory pathway lipoprotein EscJ
MDGPHSPLAQFLALYRAMPATRRWLLLIVPAVVACGLGTTIFLNRKPAEVYLLAGKIFSVAERQHAEEALRTAGLVDYRVDGQKILVPEARVTQYNAALVQEGVPAQFGAEMENLLQKYGGVFVSDKQRQELLELAKARELSKIIREIPGIEDASVLWERGRSRSFSRQGKVTATVSVRPEDGCDLTPGLIQSLRLAVAGAIGDLAVDDVTVLNMTTGTAFRGQSSDARDRLPLDQMERYTTLQQRTIAEALSYIPHVLVSVNVDLDEHREIQRSMAPQSAADRAGKSQATSEIGSAATRVSAPPSGAPRVRSNISQGVPLQVAEHAVAVELGPAEPASTADVAMTDEDAFYRRLSRSLHVNVAIPEDYYRAVAAQRQNPEGAPASSASQLQRVEEETVREVAATVARLIPAGTTADAVTVSSYMRIEPQPTDKTLADAAAPVRADLGTMVRQWGGIVLLGVLAFGCWWRLRWNGRPMPELTLPQSLLNDAEPVERSSCTDEAEAAPPREPWQGWVQANPQLAVAVLSRWITGQH